MTFSRFRLTFVMNIKCLIFLHLFSLPQGRLASPGQIVTVYGRGTLNSCGPTRLDRNKEYILYGKMSVSNIKIQILWQNDNMLTEFFSLAHLVNVPDNLYLKLMYKIQKHEILKR